MSLEDFGELRSILQHTPSLRAWYRVCELVESWPPGAFEQEVFPYIQSYIQRPPWTDQPRLAPTRWLIACFQSEKIPYFLMATDLLIRKHPLSPQNLKHLGQSPYLLRIEHLGLDQIQSSDNQNAILSQLCAMENTPALYSLSFKSIPWSFTKTQIIQDSQIGQQLTRLTINNAELTSEMVKQLLQTNNLSTINMLDLRHNQVQIQALDSILDIVSTHFPNMTRFGISSSSLSLQSYPNDHDFELF